MAATTFQDMQEENDTGGADATSALIEVPADGGGEITITNDQLAADGLVGDWSREDLNFPRINIVAKTGGLLDDGFELGALVLNRETTLAKKDVSIKVIVLNCIKKYQEDVPWGGDTTAKTFDTKKEMVEAGYSTEYGAVNYCQPLAHVTFLIPFSSVEDGDGVDKDAFPFEYKGDHWAMAQFTASKTNFKTVGKPIASYLAFGGQKKLHGTWWEFNSGIKSFGDNTWFGAFLRRKDKVSEETLEFVESVM